MHISIDPFPLLENFPLLIRRKEIIKLRKTMALSNVDKFK